MGKPLRLLDTAIRNFSIGAFLQDLGVGLKHFTKWHKMAVVSESGTVNRFSDLFSYIAPGETAVRTGRLKRMRKFNYFILTRVTMNI